VQISSDLVDDEKDKVKSILTKCTMVLTDLTGNCNIGEHEIKLTSDEPIMSRSYQLPHATKDTETRS